jgi:phospholipid N-methyltransferase
MSPRFLSEFLRDPSAIGAIAPSSSRLAKVITAEIGIESARVVVEYGPGTGAFTGAILQRLAPGAVFFAIEQNPQMAAVLRQRFPSVTVYEDSVANLGRLLQESGIEAVDCIVSGLPWASFSSRLQDELLGQTLAALRPGGRFATFAYLQGLLMPAGRRFRHKLHACFSQVERSPVVWCNLPPAFVYRCTR